MDWIGSGPKIGGCPSTGSTASECLFEIVAEIFIRDRLVVSHTIVSERSHYSSGQISMYDNLPCFPTELKELGTILKSKILRCALHSSGCVAFFRCSVLPGDSLSNISGLVYLHLWIPVNLLRSPLRFVPQPKPIIWLSPVLPNDASSL